MYAVIINGRKVPSETADALRDLFTAGHRENFREMWVQHGEARMVALANKGSAFLMMLRFEGDTGFTSRNQADSGPSDATMAFMLSNGQLDEYPESWVLPEGDWTEALVDFAVKGIRSDKIEWHKDG